MTTKSVEAVRDTILQFNHEHEGWPAPERVMAGGFDECLDCAESLARRCMAAHIEALTAEVERLKLDLQAKDCLQDSAYQAGMKHGWNCAVSGDRDAYDTAISSEHIAELRRVNEARAALQPQEKVG